MAKKAEIKKIRPSDAVRSLEVFNERVLMLIGTCSVILSQKLIDERVASALADSVNAVKEFYADDI